MQGMILPICSIFFSILLCIIFFLKKRMPLLENNMYTIMIIVVLIDSILVTILQSFSFFNITPTIDIISLAIVPFALNPIRLKSHPPTKPPSIPRIIFFTQLVFSCMTAVAMHPAIAPMIILQIIPILLTSLLSQSFAY